MAGHRPCRAGLDRTRKRKSFPREKGRKQSRTPTPGSPRRPHSQKATEPIHYRSKRDCTDPQASVQRVFLSTSSTEQVAVETADSDVRTLDLSSGRRKSSDPRTHITAGWTWEPACNPGAWKVEIGEPRSRQPVFVSSRFN